MFGLVDVKKCLSSPNHLIKLLVVIACTCFSVYQVGQCVERLLSPPITTYYGFNLNESMTYPSVTICRRPGFKDDLFPKFGLQVGQTMETANVFRFFDFENYTIKDFFNETTYHFEEVFQLYAYNGKGLVLAEIEWMSFYSTKHGQCFSFTPQETSKNYNIGGGWWFYLRHDKLERLVDSHGVSQYGFHIYLHDSNEILTSAKEQDDSYLEYIYIESMEDIRINLRYQEFYKVNVNENPCIDPAAQPHYSRSRCMEECFFYRVTNTTNCTLPWLWLIPDDFLPQCNDVDSVTLLTNLFLEHNRNSLIKNCSCPMSCHVSIYTPTIVRRKAVQDTKEPHSFIALYYTNNLVTLMREVMGYNFTAFISDIGGSLGFLLGLSVVGLIKVLEKIVCSCIKTYYNKKKKPEEEHYSDTQSNVRSSFSESTKIVDDISLGKRNNGEVQQNMYLYDNLKDFDSDDFKYYQKTLIAEGSSSRF
ncbi:acid-sensing ion channel 4-A isoform X1 [Euwallacea fornicatus]|uniref:acid-sensing ion channel 4-A isoform X1 n=1 Tax=Euwallacea fornicatus TaxID=995702 RepID=UPI00338EB9E1